ncbi:hypothetical protein D3C71_1674220 [compost metagenome]
MAAGIINAAPTPPSNLETNKSQDTFARPKSSSEKANTIRPATITFFRPILSDNLPANGDTNNWARENEATNSPTVLPVIPSSFM